MYNHYDKPANLQQFLNKIKDKQKKIPSLEIQYDTNKNLAVKMYWVKT